MVTEIKVYNDFCYLSTDNDRLKEVVYQALRKKDMHCFKNPKYRMRVWDGFINYFSKKTGKFLSGLLPEVLACCDYCKIKPVIHDYRINQEFAVEKIDNQFLNKEIKDGLTPDGTCQKEFILDPLQVDLINLAIRYKRGIIQAPTGFGKSAILVSLILALPKNLKILVLSMRKSVVNQNHKELLKWGISDAVLFSSKKKDGRVLSVNVASVKKVNLESFDVIITDEVHMCLSKTSIRAYRRMTNASIRIGISATPFKYGGKDLISKYDCKGHYGPVFKTNLVDGGIITTSHLQDDGRLSKSQCKFFKIKEPDLELETYIDAVTLGIVENNHFNSIVANLCKGLKGRTLVLVDRLNHGDLLHAWIPGSLWIQGKDDDETRAFVYEKLLNSTSDVIAIATTGTSSTGVNVKIHNLVNAAGGKAEHEIVQRMGRGLRTADDKDVLNYYDFYFSNNDYLEKHSRLRMKILKKEGHQVEVIESTSFII
jgi:superfamily II DNA or RNA helicase